jgi:NAD(P)-dependent dehydrogenase (short-subunit alcohol dehydrogenase family)
LLQRRGLATHRDVTNKQTPYEKRENVGNRKHSQFDIDGKVFVVTGGGQGLGFSIAEGLVEAGGTVHVLDRSSKPTREFEEAVARAKSEFDGKLEYHQADVTNEDMVGKTIGDIAAQKQRLDGLVAGSWRSSKVFEPD